MEAVVPIVHLIFTIAGLLAISWFARHQGLPDRNSSKAVLAALIVGVAVFELASFTVSTPPDRFHDFRHAYYPAGVLMAHNDATGLRLLTEQGVSGFVNLPIVAYLFAPLGIFNVFIASAVFTLVGLIVTVASWFLIVRLAGLDHKGQWLLALLFLSNGALINAIKYGNLSYFILLPLAGGLLSLRSGRSGLAGVILGLSTIIKPPLLLFGLFFALRRDFKGTAGFAASLAMSGLLSLLVFGWDDNLNWFNTTVVVYSQHWLSDYNVQSISAFLLRLHSNANLVGWQAHTPQAIQMLESKILTAVILAIAGFACLPFPGRLAEAKTTERQDLEYLLVICLCLITSPLTWSHYYQWLLVPAAFFLGGNFSFSISPRAKAATWTAILLVTPLTVWPWTFSNPVLMAGYQSIIVSFSLFGGLLWFGLLSWWVAQSGGFLSRTTKTAGVAGHVLPAVAKAEA